jgi:hypothetical protein
VHKANLGSQLSIFDTGSFARARPRPNDPPERVHTGALKRPARTTETNRQGRAGKTSCTNVHKANLGSQLSIFDTGSFARVRPRPNDPPERVHMGALKRPARTTPKRSDKGEPGKRAARTCTKPTSGHNLAFLIRARSNSPSHAPQTTRPNEFTRAPSNDPPERFCMGARTTETNRQGRAGQTSCTNVHKANLGSQLSIFDTGSFARARPQTPERPTRTSSHGRPQTTRPNDFAWAPNDRNEPTRESRANELHERAQSQPRVTT